VFGYGTIIAALRRVSELRLKKELNTNLPSAIFKLARSPDYQYKADEMWEYFWNGIQYVRIKTIYIEDEVS
jgi:hypothetical protein